VCFTHRFHFYDSFLCCFTFCCCCLLSNWNHVVFRGDRVLSQYLVKLQIYRQGILLLNLLKSEPIYNPFNFILFSQYGHPPPTQLCSPFNPPRKYFHGPFGIEFPFTTLGPYQEKFAEFVRAKNKEFDETYEARKLERKELKRIKKKEMKALERKEMKALRKKAKEENKRPKLVGTSKVEEDAVPMNLMVEGLMKPCVKVAEKNVLHSMNV